MDKNYKAVCDRDDGCKSCQPCLVKAVKEPWQRAGIETSKDHYISLKVKKLDSQWTSLNRNKSKTSDAARKARQEFEVYLDTLFDIASQDAEKVIMNDRLRSADTRQEDIDFLRDQRGDRKMGIGSQDTQYKKKVIKKVNREKAAKDYTDKEIETQDSEERNVYTGT